MSIPTLVIILTLLIALYGVLWHDESAADIRSAAPNRPAIKRVHYPGLPDHPDRALERLGLDAVSVGLDPSFLQVAVVALRRPVRVQRTESGGRTCSSAQLKPRTIARLEITVRQRSS